MIFQVCESAGTTAASSPRHVPVPHGSPLHVANPQDSPRHAVSQTSPLHAAVSVEGRSLAGLRLSAGASPRHATSQDNLSTGSNDSNQELRLELQMERRTVEELVEDAVRQKRAGHRQEPAAEGSVGQHRPGEEGGEEEEEDEEESLSSPATTIVEQLGGAAAAENKRPPPDCAETPAARRDDSVRQKQPLATPRSVESVRRSPLVARGKSASFCRPPSNEQGDARPQRRGSPVSGGGGVALRQSGWATRQLSSPVVTSGFPEPKVGPEQRAEADAANFFQRKRDLWEKRTGGLSDGEEKSTATPQVAGFRGNRNFWEQRSGRGAHPPALQQLGQSKQQTPDLVMDLPAATVAGSPPGTQPPHHPVPRPRLTAAPAVSSASLRERAASPSGNRSRSPSSDSSLSVGGAASDSSSSSSSSSPAPGAAKYLTSADLFASPDTDTLKKLSSSSAPRPKPRPEHAASDARRLRQPEDGATPQRPAAAGQAVGGKPALRVKPVLQVRPAAAPGSTADATGSVPHSPK